MKDIEDEIAEVIQKAVHEMPRTLLQKLLKEKFQAVGVKVKEAKFREAIEHILSGSDEDFIFGDKQVDEANVELSDGDFDAIIEKVESFVKNDVPAILLKSSDQAADGLYKELSKRWAKEHNQQVKDLARFKKNLETRYGEGLNKLRMLVTIAREWGQEVHTRRLTEGKGQLSHLDDALLRLHVRACQVTLEIVILLETGLADGAMARWRTLHEIATVTLLLKEHGDEVAERYVRYQIVESKKALTAYQECREDLGYDEYSEEEARQIMIDYEAAIAAYGQPFSGEYGWIAHILGEGPSKRVTFAMLQKATGMGVMRAHYQMASYNVHASPKGAYFRLGQLEQTSNILLAGSSNAGLVEPAQNAGLSLGKITMTVCSDSEAAPFQNNVFIKVVNRLMQEIPPDFAEADRTLKEDEEKLQRQSQNGT